MVLALFAGCNKSEDGKETTPGTTTPQSQPATTSEPATTTEETFDFKGYEFTISTGAAFPRRNEDGSFVSAKDEEWYEKYLDLEEKYNIKIVRVDVPGDALEVLTSYGMSGDKAADLFFCRQTAYWPAGKAGYVLPVSEGKLAELGLNCFDETRWFQPAVLNTALLGKYWGLQVASKYIAVPSGYFITFNKELVAEAGYDNLYDMVRNKTWRYDVYMDIARKTTKDTDGDGVPDIWGTGATAWGNEILTNNVDYVGPDASGRWVFQANSKEGLEALEFLYEMNFGSKTRWDESSKVCRQGFADGKVAFNFATMSDIDGPTKVIYNSNHDYGIVPMPLGPSGTDYVAGHANNDCYVIQASNKDLDKVVKILNDWALIVNDTESYLEMLDDGRCRTPEDKEMMIEYIIPKFGLCKRKVNPTIDDLLADEFIGSFSYGGYTPAQAIEAFADRIQQALDDFFGQ